MKKLVCESLLEFINREEDVWADKEIDRYFGKKEGKDPSIDPKVILKDPEWVEIPSNKKDIEYPLEKIRDHIQGKELSPNEFKNLCIWIIRLPIENSEIEAIINLLLSDHMYIINDVQSGEYKYVEGIEIIRDKLEDENS